jgi:hypothetical protein
LRSLGKPFVDQTCIPGTQLIDSAFGGLIATGVSFMSGKGGLYGWQWL